MPLVATVVADISGGGGRNVRLTTILAAAVVAVALRRSRLWRRSGNADGLAIRQLSPGSGRRVIEGEGQLGAVF
jgi:hypothetical protein